MAKRRAVLIVGSPRRKSTSESLGAYLMERLTKAGFETITLKAATAVQSESGTAEMVQAVREADLVVLSFPLYLDAPPFSMMRAMEQIGARRRNRSDGKQEKQRLLAIVNCGNPEAHHNDCAIQICRLFARRVGFEWAGGMRLGMGGMIDGADLKELGKELDSVRGALDLAAASLAEGMKVPEKARAMMSKPLAPIFPQAREGQR
jgi:putative NADPH-quinone reductase